MEKTLIENKMKELLKLFIQESILKQNTSIKINKKEYYVSFGYKEIKQIEICKYCGK